MEAKTSEWRPGPTVCRCCLTEGCYKDISTEYFWMGKREVYSEMLSETFSVSISYSKSGGPNSQSRLICEQCISRLRDAADFKRQVVECEKMFMQHLDPGTSSVVEFSVPQVESSEKVKLERVKVEKVASDDDFDDGGFPDDDDDDDDLDDQPLMKLASKIPKKESLDLRDLLDNTKLVLKRKAPPTSKSKPVVPTKKLKSKKEVKPAPSKAKAVAKPAPKPVEKKKKEQNSMYVARENAQTIVQYTTAYPFRLPESHVVCVFCCQTYPDPEEFRRHMETEHQEFKVRIAFAHINEGYLKVDCTDLRCRLCSEPFAKLDEAAEHLKVIHNKRISFDFDLGVQPFILKKDVMSCAICGHKSSILRMLSRHIQKHYLQCTCENCGKSYATPTSLQQHIRDSCPQTLNNQKRCRKCRKTFATAEEKRKHLESSKRCGHYICNVCGDRFTYWRQKQQHLEEVHGAPKKTYTCLECGLVFNKANSLSQHFKTAHTNEYFECVSCGRKYDNEYRLKRHRLVHTGEKAFSCPVCSKAFPRKSTLTQHMWIHSEVKKYECKLCDKPFNQKVSWRTHMRSRHPDLGEF